MWLAVEPGLVRAIAFDAMVVAGVSTVVFNGNPLLRYDGYYILADLLEIPNLAQRATRYWGYLVDRYVFRTDGLKDFVATDGERIWLLLYAPAAFLYRQVVMLTIAIFIASQYLAVGVAIAIWSLFTGVALPIGKALWQVLASPRFHRNRTRAVTATFGLILAVSIVMFLIPAPLYTTTEGVVWLPENAVVRAGTDGFVRALLVEPGKIVTAGEALVESEEPTLKAELEILRARVAELETRLATERFTDRVKAEITTTEIGQARAELATATGRAERLVARSRGEGTFAVMKPQDLPGRFLREGQQIGYVLPRGLAHRARDDPPGRHRPRSSSAAQHLGQARGAPGRDPAGAASSAKCQQGATTFPARPWAARAAAPSRSIRATRTAPRHCSACSRWTSSCLRMLRRRPRSAAAPTCASTMNGSRRASRSGGACGSSCCPGFRSEVISMLLARRRRQIIDAGSLAADAPYAEQAERKEGRLDGALLGAWGRVSPYLLSALAR